MSKNIYDHGLFFTRTPTAVRYEIRRSLIQIRPSLPQRYERMGCQYSMGAPPCCFSRPFRAPKLSGQNRPENRKEPWTNLELNPDVLSSFEAASGELLVAILSRSFVSRMAGALHLCGVTTPNCAVSSRRSLHCQPLWSQRVDFTLSVAGGSRLCRSVKDSSRKNVLRVCCSGGSIDVLEKSKTENQTTDGVTEQLTIAMKFGGSSVASAERMREVADLILSFPNERPVIVLSAMGKTTNKLLLAGEKAVSCGVSNASCIDELTFIKELHLRTADELGVDSSVISAHLEELEQLLKGIAMMKELTLRTKDYLVSFGECMSTRLFAAYMNKIGAKARQYDAFDIGFITTDDFTNADILEATYPAVAKRLLGDWISDPAIPIVTGFLGKVFLLANCFIDFLNEKIAVSTPLEWEFFLTTLGRGGSDLTATTLGKALGLREIQVWKDVDGVLTCDPNIYSHAKPVEYLTFDEAAELAYFGAQGPHSEASELLVIGPNFIEVLHPQSMRPAREGDIPVRVKNSYNRNAPGTLITRTRDMSKAVLTSIVLKRNVTMLDIVSTRMLGQFGFLAKVFSIFEELGISVDVVATSEVSISLTLDPSKLWSRELIQQASELDHVVEELEKIAVVNLLQHRSIISLIGNIQMSSLILEKAFHVLRTKGVNVQMISQGASKVNISLIVNDDQAEKCVRALHSAFFESLSEVDRECQSDNGSTSAFSNGH
ncbi:Aspartokinase 2, chloroplastic [Vitis vinifera]|uniref:aspartate kinase n=1 Tax=Vitis vinifera TaxID=29760 RepID=A0A438JD94_VITVI|nr:Aspartokinase 2, chloroplastic [Vitis vinifera]